MYARRSFTTTVVLLAVLSAAIYYAAPRIGPTSKAAAYSAKVQAAETTVSAENAILDADRERSVNSQLSDDPVIAAMIGLPTSPITTDAGSLRAKVTSTNPNFAALIVDMLYKAGVRKGDVVAVAYTGSFPALDIATIAATEALGAEPEVVSSVGASTWGANDPEFTILDMESLLEEKAIIHHKSLAASVGGDFRIHPLQAEGRRLAQVAMGRNEVTFLNASKLQDSIQQRLAIYDGAASGRPIKAFVNVGGGLVSVGRTPKAQFDPGLSVGPERGDIEGEGLIYYMENRGVPVVNVTDIVTLAKKYRFAVNPLELPPIGEGTPWRDWTSLRIRAATGAAIVLLAALGLRLLVLAGHGEREFDSYFGFLPSRLHALSRRLRWRPAASVGPPPVVVEPVDEDG
ncbi:MAG TPA: poly-gamma-glutamate system protein [Dehalococcoidia bacterium]|nr:poly-gamma-glutamate system protein [Dehalococcoidia bacterium]